MDFPAPGGPLINRWWRPAAAISSARRATSCPLTSDRSLSGGPSMTSPGCAGVITPCPVKWRINSDREAAPMTVAASTQAASALDPFGHRSVRSCSAAARAAGSAPVIATSVPSSDSSPSERVSLAASGGSISRAVSRATAMGRSKWLPSLGRSAGDRLMVIRFDGKAIDITASAERTRSRASLTALSGSPTMEKAGSPGATAHCTSTGQASTP